MIDILAIILIIAFSLSYVYIIYALIKAFKEGAVSWIAVALVSLLGALFIVYLSYYINEIEPAEWAQILLLLGLVGVTGFYALSATRQARASLKMAEEMREQRIMSSRPVIIQKAQQKKAVQSTITTDYFSHFEIYNAGNGPAIEVEIFLLNEERNPKSPIYCESETYLRAGEAPVKLLPVEFGKEQSLPNWIEPPVKLMPIHLAIREKCTYLVSQYQSISSYGRQPTWYQTWLPFKSRKVSEGGEIRLIPGKLEFCEEVSEKARIVMPLVGVSQND